MKTKMVSAWAMLAMVCCSTVLGSSHPKIPVALEVVCDSPKLRTATEDSFAGELRRTGNFVLVGLDDRRAFTIHVLLHVDTAPDGHAVGYSMASTLTSSLTEEYAIGQETALSAEVRARLIAQARKYEAFWAVDQAWTPVDLQRPLEQFGVIAHAVLARFNQEDYFQSIREYWEILEKRGAAQP